MKKQKLLIVVSLEVLTTDWDNLSEADLEHLCEYVSNEACEGLDAVGP